MIFRVYSCIHIIHNAIVSNIMNIYNDIKSVSVNFTMNKLCFPWNSAIYWIWLWRLQIHSKWPDPLDETCNKKKISPILVPLFCRKHYFELIVLVNSLLVEMCREPNDLFDLCHNTDFILLYSIIVINIPNYILWCHLWCHRVVMLFRLFKYFKSVMTTQLYVNPCLFVTRNAFKERVLYLSNKPIFLAEWRYRLIKAIKCTFLMRN
jgi:hypothetical protein